MLSTELEFLCTELEFFLQGWNSFYRVGMLSRGLECFRQSWNALDRGRIPLYRGRTLSTELEYICTG
jgi:hypothetical protein